MRKVAEGTDFAVKGTWHGHPNYECEYCAFSSIYRQKMDEHFQYEDQHKHKWGSVDKKEFKLEVVDEIANSELTF